MPFRFRHTALLAASLALGLPLTAHAGKTFNAVKARGMLVCGVNTSQGGFTEVDSRGQWSGLDVDFCRAVAAAVLKDPAKVKFMPLSAQQRFAALQSGEVDVLVRNSSWNLTRDASLGISFTAINYYDGQGFMVPKKFKLASVKQLKGATICIQSGTTSEKNIATYFQANGIAYKPVVFDSAAAVEQAYMAGRCQSATTDVSDLTAMRARAAKPDEHAILPEVISKEPLGPAVRRGDDEWFALIRWLNFALLEAEENGVTRANVDQLKAQSKDPAVQRLLGTAEDMGKLLGLDKEWAYRAIKAVGNYGESYERNLGQGSSLKLQRGLNNLWNKGGLMYAPPVR
ncbi:MAG TPA: amino acid ABC transporter substrate-binding protein [Burkholderiaceae bacterium]